MLSFLKANIGTIIVLLILIAIVVLIIRSLVKNKKSGKGTCGGDCSHCSAGCIHSQSFPKDNK